MFQCLFSLFAKNKVIFFVIVWYVFGPMKKRIGFFWQSMRIYTSLKLKQKWSEKTCYEQKKNRILLYFLTMSSHRRFCGKTSSDCSAATSAIWAMALKPVYQHIIPSNFDFWVWKWKCAADVPMRTADMWDLRVRESKEKWKWFGGVIFQKKESETLLKQTCVLIIWKVSDSYRKYSAV